MTLKVVVRSLIHGVHVLRVLCDLLINDRTSRTRDGVLLLLRFLHLERFTDLLQELVHPVEGVPVGLPGVRRFNPDEEPEPQGHPGLCHEMDLLPQVLKMGRLQLSPPH